MVDDRNLIFLLCICHGMTPILQVQIRIFNMGQLCPQKIPRKYSKNKKNIFLRKIFKKTFNFILEYKTTYQHLSYNMLFVSLLCVHL